MSTRRDLHHRRAAAAAHRRQPAPVPQLGFNPFPNGAPPGFNQPATSTPNTDPFGGITGLIPTDILHHSTETVIVPPTSTSSSSSTTSTTSSSTTSTSTTSSTSSTTSSTSTSTSTLITPTTSSTSSTTSIFTAPPKTTSVTVTHPLAASSPAIAAAATSSSPPATTGGTSAGVIVGGIIAAVAGAIAIIVAITFFIRRSRKRKEVDFDPGDFRRSAMPIDDPPTHDDTVARGFNPRPPTMIERHLASPAPTFGTQYGHPGPAYDPEGPYSAGPVENFTGYGASAPYQQQASYAPAQYMNNAASSPISATSAHPMYNPAVPYGQSPFSPVGSPVSQQYPIPGEGGQYEQQGPGMPQPVSYPVLTRTGSSGSGYSQEGQRQGSAAELRRESAPASDYVDLSRSSVSPFQAAQYVEISRRLNADVPAGLATPAIDRELPPVPPTKEVLERSPFADPSSAPPSPGGQYAIDRRNLELNDEHEARRASGESLVTPEKLEFPVPPSPIHSVTSSRYRIDSLPPTLPEIQIESRVSVGNYPGLRNSNAAGAAAISGLTPGLASRFPTTPSPLASSFGFPSPSADETTFSSAGAPPVPAPPPTAARAATATASASNVEFDKNRSSVHSVYNDEDAYGGI
ncbi:hypothetical protein CPB84DRAFT_1853791 [Gymnopilus junonius]|uniref:Uncharacterized protein n=1 Tax=Gymnopilus junonius TaxID=109634 RepID=A0A9P5NBP9_GYMJU|nr:hypothetical protein CPB84DRAFT_1853791 [Gymnopilus junonius]